MELLSLPTSTFQNVHAILNITETRTLPRNKGGKRSLKGKVSVV